MDKTIVMSLNKRDESGFKRSSSYTSCFSRSTSGCPLDEIIHLRSYMNRLYYGTYLPLRERKNYELTNAITGRSSLRTMTKPNTSLELKMHETRSLSQKRQLIDTNITNSELNNFFDKHWYTKFYNYNSNNYTNNVLHRSKEIQLHPWESAIADLVYASEGQAETVQNTCNARSPRIACQQSNKYQLENKTKLIKSDAYTSLKNRSISELQLEGRQHKINQEINETSKGLAKTYLHTIHCPTSHLFYDFSQRILSKESSAFESSQICYSDGYAVANCTQICSCQDICNLKNIHNLSGTSILLILPNIDHSKPSARSWNSVYTFSGSFLLKPRSTNTSYTVLLIPSSISQLADDQEMELKRQLSLKFTIGPYAQMQAVYNVMEQTTSQMKEKGTSQQFKKRSQGTGSSSQPLSSDTNGSSTGTPKRRAVKIESSVSFSIEFFKKDKGTASDVPSESHEETAAPKEKTKKKESKKKSLHRCFCTMSFPTEGRKPEECASGVCVPGECDPDACFKRIEQKYGKKKKKSASDVSSSQASQTRKTKGKEERAGKETLVKEKGSSSISKYKESVEIKEPPEKEKVSFASYMTKCCEKLRCWQQGEKDKPIALKRTATDTDIAGKTAGTPYGATAGSQSGKKKEKVKKEKESIKETPSKGEGDKKTASKKGKKTDEKEAKPPEVKKGADKKGKKPAETEAKPPEVKKEADKKGKKTAEKEAKPPEVKKGADKKSKKIEKEAKPPEVKKGADKKGKKATGKETPAEEAATKATGKKDKKATGKEVKKATEEKGTKPTGKEGKKAAKEKGKKPTKIEKKKGRPLKPYECEPGVCQRKVCSPKECYDRKFPPPPPKQVVEQKLTLFQTLLRRCCCRPVLGGEKKTAVSTNAATQSRRAAGPGITPGATVYKETGSAGPKKLKSGSKKYPQNAQAPKAEVGVPPMESGKAKGRERRVDTGVPQYTEGGELDVPAEGTGYRKQRAFTGVQYYQNVDNEGMTKRQGVNIGSECSCSVEFYKMIY